MKPEFLKEVADQAATDAAIRISKKVDTTEDEFNLIKKIIQSEIVIAFSGNVEI